MKYIIMCGGVYDRFITPKQLKIINGEEIVARTIRLLKENGINDIAISSNNSIFKKFNIPLLEHNNSYKVIRNKQIGDWLDCFYLINEPVCYLFGDVVYSENAIKKIIETKTKDIDLFGSIPPFNSQYIKNHIESFGLKVVNVKHFKESLIKTKKLAKQGKFWRKNPIIWELWTVIKNNPIEKKPNNYIYDYICINDFTCDVDSKNDVSKFNKMLRSDKK